MFNRPTTFALVAAASLVAASSASASTTINFAGLFDFTDVDNDGFREALTLQNVLSSNSGFVTSTTPGDAALSLATVLIPTLTLDSGSFVSGTSYDFAPTLYVDGFKLFDAADNELLVADLTVEGLEVNNTTAVINSALVINLTNITAGADYVFGASPVADEFVGAAQGATNVTLQATTSVESLIEGAAPGSTSAASSYSGSATVIPAPAAIGGAGLMLGGLLRRRRAA